MIQAEEQMQTVKIAWNGRIHAFRLPLYPYMVRGRIVNDKLMIDYLSGYVGAE